MHSLTLSDKDVPPAVQKMISDKESEINADDASKLIGCINALSKQVLGDEGIIKSSDPDPMKRGVAFCQTIKVSKKITATYNRATEAYIDSLPPEKKEQMVAIAAKHMDGTMSAPYRDELLGWLKTDSKENECRILTNVRCLSEGVDVPSLDAVMFLSARNSQVDVVQSVGRVMRKSPGKKYGYIIIPVVIPSTVDASIALDDNIRYKVVWTVLNALRAHDDRFNATVNKIELNKKRPAQILVGRPEYSWEEGMFVSNDPDAIYGTNKELSEQLTLQFEQLQHVVFARMVKKVGDRRYWEQWAKSVAQIAERQVERITRLIIDNKTHKKAFENFLKGLQKNINPSIAQYEAVEMLSQHIITKPVFEALFEGYSFVKNNPISVSMQTMLDLLEDQAVEKDTETLKKFYESVIMRAEGIDNAEGKQRIIIELYDKFFKTAFPKMVERLGIVYTPVEVVDFIIHSVNDVLKKEFGRSLSDENIHILDPFTGTGTFITRLLQSGLIDNKHIERKYLHEIHANEIVLLAYYIAAVNIENAYHDILEESDYKPFDGICLTDTFQLGETDESKKLFSEMFPLNSVRVAQQKKAPLRVIIGNPPYSVGQSSANLNAQNQRYEKLERRITDTYFQAATGTGKHALYDSYIKAFRWASDRLDDLDGGIIAFVSNGSWLDSNTMTGVRLCLEAEFSSIYVFNTRGNARTQGELRRREAGNVFGAGSRAPICITLLVKNPKFQNQKASIQYFDIGDYLNRKEKLAIVKKFHSAGNKSIPWKILNPNKHGDWINQRKESFLTFIPLGEKNDNSVDSFFEGNYSFGVLSSRDSWVWNFSRKEVCKNMQLTICFYNEERERFALAKKENPLLEVGKFIKFNSNKITWDTRKLKGGIKKGLNIEFNSSDIRTGVYRPFCKQQIYFNNKLNHSLFNQQNLFPNLTLENLVICLPAPGSKNEFTVLMLNITPDIHLIGDTLCFPMFYYEDWNKEAPTLFEPLGDSEFIRKEGVSDFILDRAKNHFGKSVTKEDIFYYVYGILHSTEYREAFTNDLKKMLPRLPLIDDVRDFWKFSKAGRELTDLHLNYESIDPNKDVTVKGVESGFYKVEKMRFPKKDQKDTIIYNSKITIENIPPKAYEYVVNGKSAIEWIMERYQIKTHKESGITNDPNDWSDEVGNPRYILDLLLSIINVSVRTVDIVRSLPKMKFE